MEFWNRNFAALLQPDPGDQHETKPGAFDWIPTLEQHIPSPLLSERPIFRNATSRFGLSTPKQYHTVNSTPDDPVHELNIIIYQDSSYSRVTVRTHIPNLRSLSKAYLWPIFRGLIHTRILNPVRVIFRPEASLFPGRESPQPSGNVQINVIYQTFSEYKRPRKKAAILTLNDRNAGNDRMFKSLYDNMSTLSHLQSR